MGRPKEFDREETITKAVELFRQNGFSDTSTQQLVEHLGINRKSMYAEFGNKQRLFETALARYKEMVVDKNFGPLEEQSASLPEICALFRQFAGESKGSAAGVGCLMCNTAVEQVKDAPTTQSIVADYVSRVTNAFANALTNAKKRGEIHSRVNPRQQAQFLTSSVLGMSVLARVGAAPTLIDGSLKVTLRHLASLSE